MRQCRVIERIVKTTETVDVLTCEGPGCEAWHEYAVGEEVGAPISGWYRVEKRRAYGSNEDIERLPDTHDFCSLDCLTAWCESQVTRAAESIA